MSFGWDPEGWADTASSRTARVLLLWAGLQSRPAMWQKYKNIKIIDYQHWHLSDLLQQAASQCFLCAQRFRFGSIPSLKSLCDIDTSASTFFPPSNRRPKALVNIINSGGKKRDRFACRTSVVNRFCGILLRLRLRRLPLKKWSCFLVLISAGRRRVLRNWGHLVRHWPQVLQWDILLCSATIVHHAGMTSDQKCSNILQPAVCSSCLQVDRWWTS